jgi:hypothetical protein
MTLRHLFFLLMGALILVAGSGWAQDLLEQGLAVRKAKNREQAVELLGQLVKQDPHPGHPLCCNELEMLKAEQSKTLQQGK